MVVSDLLMLYLEHTPASPLDRMVRLLWYAQVPDAAHKRERVLPTGNIQIILNVARDFLIDCPEGRQDSRLAPSLVVGARSVYEIIDTSDMADLIGIVFQPGGFHCLPEIVRTCSAIAALILKRCGEKGRDLSGICCASFIRPLSGCSALKHSSCGSFGFDSATQGRRMGLLHSP